MFAHSTKIGDDDIEAGLEFNYALFVLFFQNNITHKMKECLRQTTQNKKN